MIAAEWESDHHMGRSRRPSVRCIGPSDADAGTEGAENCLHVADADAA
jgi:hypothetical protein